MQNITEYLTTKGIPHKLVGNSEVQVNCPMCEDTKWHLYIKNDEGCYLCHHCGVKGSWSDFLKLIGESAVIPLAKTPLRPVLVPILRKELAGEYHQQLPDRIKIYLQSAKRGLSQESIDKYLIGWDGSSITIPVFDAQGQLVNIRHRRDPETEVGSKLWGESGCPTSLFNVSILQKPTQPPNSGVFITEGEFDCIVLNQHGFPAVSGTGGAGTFKDEWVSSFTSIKTVYICYDTDKAGIDGAKRTASMLGDKAKIINLPQLNDDKTDVTEYFISHTAKDFALLVQEAKPLPIEPKKPESDATPTNNKPTVSTCVRLENGSLAEQVVDVGGRIKYLIYDPQTQVITEATELSVQGKSCVPLSGDLVTKNVVRFPTSTEEYETFPVLRDEIRSFIHKYADLSPFHFEIAVAYVFLTWLYDRASTITYLGVHNSERGTGKTRIAKTIGALCYKPVITTGSITPSVIYRLLEQARGTLVLNEFDFDKSDLSSEVIRILNNGYEKDMHVLRTEINGSKIEAFDAYGAKIFTFRRKKKDEAFESRMITLTAEETAREDIPTDLPDEFWNEALKLRNKLLLYRFRNYSLKSELDPNVFKGINRRIRQTFYPLLSVIPDPEFVRQMIELAKENQETLRVERETSWIAEAVKALVDLTTTEQVITMKKYAEQLTKLNIFGDNKDINPRKVGSIVRSDLKLKTERITSGDYKGNYGIVLDAEKLGVLCEKYGIEIPEQSSLHSLPSPTSSQESEHGEGGEHINGEVVDHGDF